MRLDRFISNSSNYSRREVRRLVRESAVLVNGVRADSADQNVAESDTVSVRGVPLRYSPYLYLMLNKPAGYLSATEDKRFPVVVSLVPAEFLHYQVFPVGRLDMDTEGLLLLTNDGAFDHALTAPSRHVVKRYYAELDAPACADDIAVFAAGMDLGDFTARPAKLELSDDPSKVFIEISEGKFHQVKRMCEKIGRQVLYLERTAIGPLALDRSLARGGVRELTEEEKQLFL